MSMPEAASGDKPLVIIGDEDAISGFSALGFKAYALKGPQEFSLTLEEVLRGGCAICLVQDNLYQAAKDQINNFRHLPFPIFIPFLRAQSIDLLDNLIKDIRIRATGAF